MHQSLQNYGRCPLAGVTALEHTLTRLVQVEGGVQREHSGYEFRDFK